MVNTPHPVPGGPRSLVFKREVGEQIEAALAVALGSLQDKLADILGASKDSMDA